MAKKNFGDLNQLTAFAQQFQTQQATAAPAPPKLRAAPAPAPVENTVKQTFELREPQRDELERLAREAKLTTRAFILKALAAKGLTVLESDLIDGRKRRRS